MKILLIMLLLAFGCAESNDESATTGTAATISNNGIYSPSGYVEDGPCLSGGTVEIRPLYSEDLAQTSEVYTTTTENNFGF